MEPFHRTERRLKQRERGSIYNFLKSIEHDSEFVAEVLRVYRLPLFANLRNGLWYAARFDGTCYFKSTDGHYGHWDFSTSRLNLHVVRAAVSHNGIIIVDSTRRGKRFPDALTRTIPIWCAVMNRACDNALADMALHLPPWLPDAERSAIEPRMQAWVERLRSFPHAVALLKECLTKPLRPMWVSPSDHLLRADWAGATDTADWEFVPVVCVSASRHIERQQHRIHHSWAYIQGAGDDEESWARGLSAQLFWKHRHAILASPDPEECDRTVATIVAAAREGRADGAQQREGPVDAAAAADASTAAAAAATLAVVTAPVVGAGHAPVPLDVRAWWATSSTHPATAAEAFLCSAASVSWLGDTGIGVAGLRSVCDDLAGTPSSITPGDRPPRVWTLHVGDAPAGHAELQARLPRAAFLFLDWRKGRSAGRAWQLVALPSAVLAASAALRAGDRVLLISSGAEAGRDEAAAAVVLAVAALLALFDEECSPPCRPPSMLPPCPLDRACVHRRLAFLQLWRHSALPEQRLVKQLTRFFLSPHGRWRDVRSSLIAPSPPTDDDVMAQIPVDELAIM